MRSSVFPIERKIYPNSHLDVFIFVGQSTMTIQSYKRTFVQKVAPFIGIGPWWFYLEIWFFDSQNGFYLVPFSCTFCHCIMFYIFLYHCNLPISVLVQTKVHNTILNGWTMDMLQYSLFTKNVCFDIKIPRNNYEIDLKKIRNFDSFDDFMKSLTKM